jgi:lipopolysaccharide transport system permease protein
MNAASLGLLRELLRRDLDSRWRGSVLGAFWAVLQPLGWIALYLTVFRLVLDVRAPAGSERHGFAVYLIVGLVPFLAMQEGILRSSAVFHENANLVRKLRIDPGFFVVTVCTSALVLEAVGLTCLIAWEAAHGLLEPRRLVWLPIGLLAQILLTLVPAFAVAILAAFFRDLLLLLPFAMTCVFYLSPIVYPLDLAPAALRAVIAGNPVAWVLQIFRAALAGAEPPSLLSLVIGIPLLAACTVALAGLTRRLRPHIADLL